MAHHTEITNLEQLLDRIEDTTKDHDSVSLATVLDAVGRRSFAPLLLIAGLVAVVPGVGDIPGVTTTMAVLVALVAGQMLFRRKRLWLPRWLLNRSVGRGKLCKTLSWARGPSRLVDRLLKPRLNVFTNATAIALGCIAVACVMPVMEVVPFGAIAAGAALVAFSLALVAHDGLLALIAFIATVLTIGLGIYQML